MADPKDTKDTIHQPDKSNQTMQHEKAKAEVSQQRQDERDKLDQKRHDEREEKSAIGGFQQSGQKSGQPGTQPSSQTGEPGRARNELDENEKKEPASDKQR